MSVYVAFEGCSKSTHAIINFYMYIFILASESKEITYIDYGVTNTKSCATKTTKVWSHVLRQPVLPPSFISKPAAVVMATGLQQQKKKHFPI